MEIGRCIDKEKYDGRALSVCAIIDEGMKEEKMLKTHCLKRLMTVDSNMKVEEVHKDGDHEDMNAKSLMMSRGASSGGVDARGPSSSSALNSVATYLLNFHLVLSPLFTSIQRPFTNVYPRRRSFLSRGLPPKLLVFDVLDLLQPRPSDFLRVQCSTRHILPSLLQRGHAGVGGGQGNYGERRDECVFRGTSKEDNLCGVT